MSDAFLWGMNGHYHDLASQYDDLFPGRVISQERDSYRVISEHGESLAVVAGKLRYRAVAPADYPAVGDFVMLAAGEGSGALAVQQILPRKSVFIRRAAGTAITEQVVAANIDTVFLCMSLNNDFNLHRLERYLAAAWESGAVPVVMLTKADLCADIAQKRAAAENIAPGVDVLVTSSVQTEGLRVIAPYLAAGCTVAFVGSSGAGKSTLINRLIGKEQLNTGGLRNDDKGRHTTTRRELIFLPGGAMVIDTPGMRELGMWDSAEGIAAAFTDIEDLAARCRFRDCTHSGEPGCAVAAALADGELAEERLLSYRKLTAENDYAANARSYLAAKEQRFKDIAKANKANRRKK